MRTGRKVPRGAELLALSVWVLATAPALAAPTALPTSDSTVEALHSDAVGTVRLVTDATGAVVEQRSPGPFGEARSAEPLTEPGQPTFAGKRSDAASGLLAFGARDYSAGLGRFTSVDPVSFLSKTLTAPQDFNLYSYGRNNPFAFVDPDGREDIPTGQSASWYQRRAEALVKAGHEDEAHQYFALAVATSKSEWAAMGESLAAAAAANKAADKANGYGYGESVAKLVRKNRFADALFVAGQQWGITLTHGRVDQSGIRPGWERDGTYDPFTGAGVVRVLYDEPEFLIHEFLHGALHHLEGLRAMGDHSRIVPLTTAILEQSDMQTAPALYRLVDQLREVVSPGYSTGRCDILGGDFAAIWRRDHRCGGSDDSELRLRFTYP